MKKVIFFVHFFFRTGVLPSAQTYAELLNLHERCADGTSALMCIKKMINQGIRFSHAHTHTRTCTHIHSLSYTHTHTHTRSYSHTHSHLTRVVAKVASLSLPLSLSLTHTHTHTHTLIHTHTRTPHERGSKGGIVARYRERRGAGVEYHFQEFNEPYAPS